jgi:hypothetical protein
LTTIITEFGKYRYNELPMGMCCSGDIFQAKVDQLLGDIEGVIHDEAVRYLLCPHSRSQPKGQG